MREFVRCENPLQTKPTQCSVNSCSVVVGTVSATAAAAPSQTFVGNCRPLEKRLQGSRVDVQ